MKKFEVTRGEGKCIPASMSRTPLAIYIGFEGIHTQMYRGAYAILPKQPLRLDEIQSMLQLIRTEMLETVQQNHEDFRIADPLEKLQNLFAEAADVTTFGNVMAYGWNDYLHFLGSDHIDLNISIWLNEEEQYGHVALREEGSESLLEYMLRDHGIIEP